MLKNVKIKKNKILCFKKININTKNLDKKPNKGGIPAKDNNIKANDVVTNEVFPKNLISFKVFRYFISKIKKIKKILININIYDIILKSIKTIEYSL